MNVPKGYRRREAAAKARAARKLGQLVSPEIRAIRNKHIAESMAAAVEVDAGEAENLEAQAAQEAAEAERVAAEEKAAADAAAAADEAAKAEDKPAAKRGKAKA